MSTVGLEIGLGLVVGLIGVGIGLAYIGKSSPDVRPDKSYRFSDIYGSDISSRDGSDISSREGSDNSGYVRFPFDEKDLARSNGSDSFGSDMSFHSVGGKRKRKTKRKSRKNK